ncbi:MAG: nuclear transport factor 2 family protein [Candidatus Thiodiazotropha sp. (ex Codakia rugifera)]|nr:nuclear transport factor 2 family protein [Candidatus Thiodiazotropha sp. (ex Codakia rugifera)]
MSNTEKAKAIIEAFSTGSSEVLNYISDDEYIQHNLSFADGKAAIKGFFADKPTGIDITVHRVLEDGDYVVVHSSYGGVWNNNQPQVVFDVFRFKNGLAVEHWDNLQDWVDPADTASGRSMVDGATEVTDLDKTEANRELMKGFLDLLYGRTSGEMTEYISSTQYDQHNPNVADGLEGFEVVLNKWKKDGVTMTYDRTPIIIVQGNFAFTASEGKLGDQPTAFYDLFRYENGLVVEHWDVVVDIPPKTEWKNKNGKF